jgi:hypothetical protein
MLELEFQYHPLLVLRIKHEYFSLDEKAGFYFKPTPDTEAWMQKTGCMLRKEGHEIYWMYDAGRLEALEMNLSYPELEKWSFWLYSQSPYTLNYTDLPAELRNFSLYFQNHTNSKHTEASLHTDTKVGLSEVFPLRRSNFNIEEVIKKTELLLEDEAGKILWKAQINARQSAEVNLQGLNDGKYTLKENGKKKETFVYLNHRGLETPLALVEISLNPQVKSEIISAIRSDQKIPLYEYKIVFKARQTFWRYYIIPKYDDNLQNISIETGSSRIIFNGPKSVELLGKQAYLFESESPLGLYEFSPYKFQLIKNKDSKGKPIHLLLRKLPCAGIESIKPANRAKDAKVYSDMIVYI